MSSYLVTADNFSKSVDDFSATVSASMSTPPDLVLNTVSSTPLLPTASVTQQSSTVDESQMATSTGSIGILVSTSAIYLTSLVMASVSLADNSTSIGIVATPTLLISTNEIVVESTSLVLTSPMSFDVSSTLAVSFSGESTMLTPTPSSVSVVASVSVESSSIIVSTIESSALLNPSNVTLASIVPTPSLSSLVVELTSTDSATVVSSAIISEQLTSSLISTTIPIVDKVSSLDVVSSMRVTTTVPSVDIVSSAIVSTTMPIVDIVSSLDVVSSMGVTTTVPSVDIISSSAVSTTIPSVDLVSSDISTTIPSVDLVSSDISTTASSVDIVSTAVVSTTIPLPNTLSSDVVLTIMSSADTVSSTVTPSVSSVVIASSTPATVQTVDIVSSAVSSTTFSSMDIASSAVVLVNETETEVEITISSSSHTIIMSYSTEIPTLILSSEEISTLSIITTSVESDNIILTSFIQSSTLSIVASEVTVNSTIEPPNTTEGLNTSSALESFWIRTVLKIRKTVDIETDEFRNDLEVKLVAAYSEAYVRQQQIDNGVFEPLLRKRRMTTSGDINLQILNITRVPDNNNVDVVYILQQNGAYVPAATATDKLNLFSDQELALRLGHVVAKNASPYNEPVVTQSAEEDKKLWIIGAVLGPIALILLIWLILCCVFRCCKKPAHEENKKRTFNEPHLVMVKRADRLGERERLDIQVIHNHEPDYVDEPIEKGSGPAILSSTKRGLYEVNPNPAQQLQPIEHKPSPKHKTPTKNRSGLTKEDIQVVSEADTLTYISEGDLTSRRPPKPKTRKSKHKDPYRMADNYQGEDSMTEPELMDDMNYHTHPGQNQRHDDELLEKAEIERRRNKQRLRERRKTDGLLHPSNNKREMESMLDSSNEKSLPDVFLQKPRKRPSKPKRNTNHSHTNEGYSDDENAEVDKAPETIHEARKRMHQLLDDAFSLLSSSTSSIGNKVNPAPQEEDKNFKPHTKPRSKKTTSPEKVAEEKLHTPMYVNPTFNSHDEVHGIETWSPYRAGDEITRISLPQTQAIKDRNPRQDKVNTTTFSENLNTSLRDNYYTTEPAKPIVIKTKGLESNGTKQNGVSHRSSAMPNGGTSYPGIQNFDDIPSTRLNFYDNMNNFTNDNMEMVTLTGNGHASPFEHRPYQAWCGDDEMDVIKNSLQPGISPSPLIESLRGELNILSRRNEAKKHNNIHIANGGDISV